MPVAARTCFSTLLRGDGAGGGIPRYASSPTGSRLMLQSPYPLALLASETNPLLFRVRRSRGGGWDTRDARQEFHSTLGLLTAALLTCAGCVINP